jgi:hypothetical protein
MSVSDSMIVHIQDAKSFKQAWDTLVKIITLLISEEMRIVGISSNGRS